MVNVWADMTCHHERWRCGEWLRHWVQCSVFWPPDPHSAWWHISPPWLSSSSFTKGEINRQGSFFQLQKCRFHPSNSVVLYQQAQMVRQIYSAAFTFQSGTKYLLLYMAWVGGGEEGIYPDIHTGYSPWHWEHLCMLKTQHHPVTGEPYSGRWLLIYHCWRCWNLVGPVD